LVDQLAGSCQERPSPPASQERVVMRTRCSRGSARGKRKPPRRRANSQGEAFQR
jgi:hypothetical protein